MAIRSQPLDNFSFTNKLAAGAGVGRIGLLCVELNLIAPCPRRNRVARVNQPDEHPSGAGAPSFRRLFSARRGPRIGRDEFFPSRRVGGADPAGAELNTVTTTAPESFIRFKTTTPPPPPGVIILAPWPAREIESVRHLAPGPAKILVRPGHPRDETKNPVIVDLLKLAAR